MTAFTRRYRTRSGNIAVKVCRPQPDGSFQVVATVRQVLDDRPPEEVEEAVARAWGLICTCQQETHSVNSP